MNNYEIVKFFLFAIGYLIAGISFYYGSFFLVGSKKYSRKFSFSNIVIYALTFSLTTIPFRREYDGTYLYDTIKIAFALYCIIILFYNYYNKKEYM